MYVCIYTLIYYVISARPSWIMDPARPVRPDVWKHVTIDRGTIYDNMS